MKRKANRRIDDIAAVGITKEVMTKRPKGNVKSTMMKKKKCDDTGKEEILKATSQVMRLIGEKNRGSMSGKRRDLRMKIGKAMGVVKMIDVVIKMMIR